MMMKKTYKARVFKICNNDNNMIFVGSTKQKLSTRLSTYRRDMELRNNKRPWFNAIRESGGFPGWRIVLLEEFDCANHDEMIRKEQEWIEKLRNNYVLLNSAKVPRSSQPCECGGAYNKYMEDAHRKTRRHQQYMQSLPFVNTDPDLFEA